MSENTEAMKDRSKLCYICDMESIEFFFPCGNGACLDCLEEHLKTILESYRLKLFSPAVEFRCISSCRCPVSSSQMEHYIQASPRLKDLNSEILLKLYLNQTKDIAACPNSKCMNFGFFQCLESDCGLTCNLCHHAWKSRESNFLLDVYENLLSPVELRSTFLKFFTTKHCNRCRTPIERNAGCKHIDCNRCGYSFCWRCTGDWATHKEKHCRGVFANEYEESLNFEYSVVLIFVLAAFLLMKVLSTFVVIIYFALFLVKAVYLACWLALDSLCLFLSLNQLLKYRKTEKFALVVVLNALTQVFLFYFGLLPFADRNCLIVKVLNCLVTLTYGFLTRLFYR